MLDHYQVVGLICHGKLDLRLALIALLHRVDPVEGEEDTSGVSHEEFALIWSSLSEIFSNDQHLEASCVGPIHLILP
jgi:hypothetical protein